MFVDGFGILHPREFGSASDIGVKLNIPTVGIAKTLFCIHGLNEKVVKSEFKTKCKIKGDFFHLVGSNGKLYGAALKTSNDMTNPLYISIGHKISLQTAIHLVLLTCEFKNPEPIRNSDIKSKLYL